MRPAYYNEIEAFPCSVLRERIAEGLLPAGDVDERDIRLVSPDDLIGYGQIHLFAGIGGGALACRLAGVPDSFPIITAGVPCQPSSVAGSRLGESDERWLWPEFIRLLGARVLRSHYVLAENPTGLLTLGDGGAFAGILAALAAIDRDVEGACVSAADVGASHERERLWLIVYPASDPAGDVVADAAHGTEPRQPEITDGAAVVEAGARASGGNLGGHPAARVHVAGGIEGGEPIGLADAAAPGRRSASRRGGEPGDGGGALRAGEAESHGCGGALADAGCGRVQPLGDAGAVGGAPIEDAGEGLQRERRSAEAPGRGEDGGVLGDANRAGWEERHAPAVAAGARLDPGATSPDGALADRDREGRRSLAACDRAEGTLDVGVGHDADRRDDHRERNVGRPTDSSRNIERPTEPALGGAADGVPAYLGGAQWPARPGEPQHGWEEPRLVSALEMNGRKALAAYGNAWVPQAAVPALRVILAHAATRTGGV